jgi:hypothetical protein
MSPESRRAAGILLVVLPTVIFGGVSILSFLISPESGYMSNPLRQDLWRAGHAHAGVFLVLSLVALRYVDEAVSLRPPEKLCALGVAGGGHSTAGRVLPVGAKSARASAKRADLYGLRRRHSSGRRTNHTRRRTDSKSKAMMIGDPYRAVRFQGATFD